MTYESFALVYDDLMQHVPYDSWIRFIETIFEKHQIKPRTILDLGCGTGEMTLRLSENGYLLTGVDQSSDMLAVAAQKSLERKLPVTWVEQDITVLKTQQAYDVVVSFCDVFNYLTEENDVRKAFQHVHSSLKEGGFFIFDVHSQKYVNDVLIGKSFSDADEQISFIWVCHSGNQPDEVEHELTFFVHDQKTSLYRRFDEVHIQRTFPMETYKKWLDAAGFEVAGIYGDYSLNRPDEKSDRLFFVSKKK